MRSFEDEVKEAVEGEEDNSHFSRSNEE